MRKQRNGVGGGNSHQRAVRRDSREQPLTSPVLLEQLENRNVPIDQPQVFNWKSLLQWDFLGWLISGFFLCVGFGLLAIDWFPHNLLIAQLAFSSAAVLCTAKIIGYFVELYGKVWMRALWAVLLSLLVVAVDLVVAWNIQLHKYSNTIDPKASQVRMEKVEFFPPTVGQQQRVDLHYQNYGPSSTQLKINSEVAVVAGNATLGETPEAEIIKLEESVWSNFVSKGGFGSKSKASSFMKTPPFRDTWTSVMGPVINAEDGREVNDNTQKILIFVLAKFQWKDEDTDKLYGYELCEFITGSPSVVFDCHAHNGPFTP